MDRRICRPALIESMDTEVTEKFSVHGRTKVLCCLIALLTCSAYSAHLPVRIYTTADGLPRDQINKIVKDSRGFLWFCTFEGLSRFDGYNFTNYSIDQGLPDRSVNDLLETRGGAYWIATGNGVSRFDPTGSPAPTIPPRGSSFFSSGDKAGVRPMFVTYHLPDERARFVSVLAEGDDGAIWCGTGNGVYLLSQTGDGWAFQFVDFNMSHATGDDTLVNDVRIDKRDSIWVGTGTALYRRSRDGHTDRFTKQQGLPDVFVQTILQDREGQIWIGTRYGGLCRLVTDPRPGDSIVSESFSSTDGLRSNWINRIFQTDDGRLWIATIEGFSKLDSLAEKQTPRFQNYTTANGLSDSEVETLAEDRDGNLWAGTKNGGAIKLARSGLTTYSEADGLRNSRITSIFPDQSGRVCVSSTRSGWSINCYDETGFPGVRLQLPHRITQLGWGWNQTALQDHLGEWWIPTAEGLCRFPATTELSDLARSAPKAIYASGTGLPNDEIFRLFEDSHGDIWISTLGEGSSLLTRWDRASETFQNFGMSDGLPHQTPSAFRQDPQGNLWIGFYQGGLAKFSDNRFSVIGPSSGLPAGTIRALFLDHLGRLWIASSQGGLSRIDKPADVSHVFQNFNVSSGLSSNDIWCVTEDHSGRLYIGTGRGMDRLDPMSGNIKHYTTADGLAQGEVEDALCDHEGTLWFGTVHGLSRLIPQEDPPAGSLPIFINSLKIAGSPISISELGDTSVARLLLEPTQNQIQIEFVGLDFGTGDVLRYEFMLEGSNSNWSEPTENRVVNFANLAPGAYRFSVRAVSSNGVASREPAVFPFTILRPVWQRWWFVLIAVVMTGFFAYLAWRYRFVRQLELERVRTRIATDLHDDIGSNLTKIAILSEVAHMKLSPIGNGDVGPLTAIARISRESVASMSDIVWAINPHKDSLLDLTRRMRQFAIEVLSNREIKLNFQIPVDIQKVKLNADVRRNVFLIFKESITNAVRHSGCTVVDVRFNVERSHLVFEITDDGIGFDENMNHDGNGIQNMQRRALDSKCELSISTSIGHGAQVRIRIPRASSAFLSK